MTEQSTALKLKKWLLDILHDIAGGLLFAVATQCFNAPNNIAPGGVSGISILINHLFGVPISVMSLLLNIPLLLAAFFLLGRKFTYKTMKTVLIMTLMLEVAGRVFPQYHGNTILAALYGGVFSGIGLAVVFMRGSTTGGTDIIARLLQLKLPYLPVGRLLLMVDACVLIGAAIVYKNIESALYAMIAIFTGTRLVDSILYGLDTGKVLLIISEKHGSISKIIETQLHRGCTLLQGSGTYTGQERPVLMCAVRKQQFYELKTLVHGIDPTAFIMVLEANEVLGQGFKDFTGQEKT